MPDRLDGDRTHRHEALTASFGNFLAILLYLFTPWTAINLIDFYVVRKGHYSVREIFNKRGMYGIWNWHGLVAYALGFIAMIPFFSTDNGRGRLPAPWGARMSRCWWDCRWPHWFISICAGTWI